MINAPVIFKKNMGPKKDIASLFLVFAILFACALSHAQENSISLPLSGGSKKSPMTINADSINIDIAKNIAVFTGNVRADNGESVVTCKKMTIILEDKKAVNPGDPVEKSKQISRVLCEGQVMVQTGEIQDSNRKAGN